MDEDRANAPESDHRFPSGPWTGFFLHRAFPGRHWMELKLEFRSGRVEGSGRDWVGPFLMVGAYNLEDGRCTLDKRYIGLHSVDYQGYNEGKGIWGVWRIGGGSTGGFHIWPESMGDPTGESLKESVGLAVAEAAMA